MFDKGQYIVYGSNGVYKVEDITKMEMSGVNEDTLYYVLEPQNSSGSKIYTPVDRIKNARIISTKEEMVKVFDSVATIEPFDIPNVKLREQQYKESMTSCDCTEWVKIIKTTYAIKNERKLLKKRLGYIDDKYLKDAQASLFCEMSAVLDMPKEEIETRFFAILDNLA